MMSSSALVMPDTASYGTSSLAGMGAAMQSKKMSETQVEAVSKDFESTFLGQMLESMFGDSIGTEAFGNEDTSDVYKGMMMEQYGKIITQSGGIGIADYVKRELLKLQETNPRNAKSKLAPVAGADNENEPDPATGAGITGIEEK